MVFSNVGAAVLYPLGLVNFIADTEADYVRKAIRCAANLDALAALRLSLRGRISNSTQLSPREITRAVENKYRKGAMQNPAIFVRPLFG